ncbi:MAG: amidohydrolase family protein [Planctomycetes bacterium]|nr:amidohydrolase family protein [Planctomycetota bacterium]
MRLLTTLLVSSCFIASAAAQSGSVAVRASKIMRADGSVIEQGTMVIENGRITAIGDSELEIPFDVLLNEYPTAVVFPGFFEAHSNSGMDRANENVPLAPFLNVKDSIDPVSFYFEDELRGGTVAIGVMPGNNTVIGGRGRVVAPAGMTIEQMTLSDDLGMKIAVGPKSGWSRSSQLAELREAVDKLNIDLREIGEAIIYDDEVRADREKAGVDNDEDVADGDMYDSAGGYIRFGDDFAGKDLISEEDLDDTQRGMVDILNGDERLWIYAPTATDIMHAQTWLNDNGLLDGAVFVVNASAHKGADMLASMGRPVVISGDMWHVETNPITEVTTKTFAPLVLHEAGVKFAISSQEGRMGPDRLAYQASMCIREGVPRAAALAAVTTNPADFWGMSSEIGDFNEGADGTFVVFDRDPLHAQAQVLEVYIRGDKVYDRKDDTRLQRLQEGTK